MPETKIQISQYVEVFGDKESGERVVIKLYPGQLISVNALKAGVFNRRNKQIRVLKAVGQRQPGEQMYMDEFTAGSWISRGLAEAV